MTRWVLCQACTSTETAWRPVIAKGGQWPESRSIWVCFAGGHHRTACIDERAWQRRRTGKEGECMQRLLERAAGECCCQVLECG